MRLGLLPALVVGAFHAVSAQGARLAPVEDSARAMVAGILATGRHAPQRWPLLPDVIDDLRRWYSTDTAALFWSRGGVATPSARLLIRELETLEARGLDPADFDAGPLRARAARGLPSAAARADFDVMLSVASVRVLRALRNGRIPAAAAHANLRLAKEPFDALAAAQRLARSDAPSAQLDEAEPPFLHYRLLKSTLAHYRGLARDSSLPTLSFRGALRPEATDSVVPALRRWLVALGDVHGAASASNEALRYDSALVAGVKRFQRRHGMTADGIVGTGTQSALTMPMAARVEQIALALERWRWAPRGIGSPPPIVVNIPAFRLHALTSNTDREADMLSMDIVVGEAYDHATPVFSATLDHIIFSPYWEVPPSILRKEILPKARRDPRFLAREGFEVVGHNGSVLGISTAALAAAASGEARVRQRPGAANALGGVKFMFPNAFNVYMHDTPAQHVFARARRDASHGCIRLAEPARLARFLLRDQPGWDSTAIAMAMAQSSPTRVNLSRAVPVYVVYATAVAKESGEVQFFQDIYGHDRALRRLLNGGYPFPGHRR